MKVDLWDIVAARGMPNAGAQAVRMEEGMGDRERGIEGLLSCKLGEEVLGKFDEQKAGRGTTVRVVTSTDIQARSIGAARDDSFSSNDSRLRTARTGAYLITFVAIGLMVGVCGPSIPFLMKRVSPSMPEGANLAPAFAVRGVGGLGGSVAGAFMLSFVPGHRILGSGLLAGAVGIALLSVTTSVGHVAAS